LTINKIITDSFDDDDIPKEIRKIIARFLEVEDTSSYTGSKDKMYEQILKNVLKEIEKDQREKILKWCNEYL
jgi:hypothetical protein